MRRSVGLAVNGSETTWLPPQSGDNQRWDILRALAVVHPGSRSLGEFLRLVEPDIRANTSLVLITPSLRGELVRSAPAARLARRHPHRAAAGCSFFCSLPADLTQPAESKPRRQVFTPSCRTLVSIPTSITRDLLEKAEAHPGRAGRWEWHVLPRGRAVAVNRPPDLDWRSLS